MDSDRLLKFIGYSPDYLSALSRTLLRFFGQPLSKQLYITKRTVSCSRLELAFCKEFRAKRPCLACLYTNYYHSDL